MNFERMRGLLLDQAIHGKLVPQDSDEGAVDQIGTRPEVVPFAIPDSWRWVTLESISSVISKGTTPKGGKSAYLSSGIGFVRVNNFGDDGQIDTREMKFIDEKVHQGDLKRSVLEADDVLVSIAGTLGRTVVVRDSDLPLNANQAVSFIRLHKSEANARYVHLAISSPRIQKSLCLQVKVTAIPNLTLQIIRECVIPLPPLGEQARIVDKLEESLAEIDRAEKAYQELQTLSGVLRGHILQEAIQGKLVPQLESEEEVQQIGDAPEDVPFEIPEKWKWVQLKSVGTVIGGGTPKTSVSEYWGDDVSWITPADLGKISSKWIHKGAKSITQKGLDESSAKLMPEGSVVYSSRAPIGHIAIAGQELCTNQGCKSFVPNEEVISTEWAYYMLIARTKDIQSRASGTTFKEISGKGVGETWITLPPLEEQKRIVAKVEDLLKQVASLSAR